MIEINKNPSVRELRWFGVLFAAFFALVGAIVAWRFGAARAGAIIASSAAVVAAAYYAMPPVRRPLYLGWMYAAYPIGWTVTHLLLAVIYYVVMTPIGIIMRLVGRDPMTRKFDRLASTYWVEHDPGHDEKRYFRQF